MATLSPPARHQPSAASDERLVALAREGDDVAFAAIVERYGPLLVRRARRIAGDEAQDAVQHAFINAWNALRGGCEVRDLRAWLCTIAHRAALQTLHERSERAAELPDSLAGRSSPVDQFEQSTRARTILSAVAKLPASEQEALVSTSLMGFSGRVTATSLGISEGAVRQLVFRARIRLRAAISVFVPPIAMPRMWERWGQGARRVTALGDGASRVASSPESAGTLVKLGATLAAGLAIGAPVVVLNGDREQDHRRHTPTTAATAGHPTTLSPGAHGPVETGLAHPRNTSGPAGHGVESTAVKHAGAAAAVDRGVASGDPTGLPAGARDDGPRATPSEAHDDRALPRAAGEAAGSAPPIAGQVVSEAKGGSGPTPPVVHQALPVVSEAVQGVQAVAQEARGTLTSTGEAVVQKVKEILPPPSKVVQSLPPVVHLP